MEILAYSQALKVKIFVHSNFPYRLAHSDNPAFSSRSLHEVPSACMQFHELTWSSMSLHAIAFFVWAAHKNFAVLVCYSFRAKQSIKKLLVVKKSKISASQVTVAQMHLKSMHQHPPGASMNIVRAWKTRSALCSTEIMFTPLTEDLQSIACLILIGTCINQLLFYF